MNSDSNGTPIGQMQVEIAVVTAAVRMADDPRVQVRRSALGMLESALPSMTSMCSFALNEEGPGNDLAIVCRRGFETCAQRCVDVSQQVRYQAMKTTTEVLKTTMKQRPGLVDSDSWQWMGKIWISTVLPLVDDQEQRIQEKLIELAFPTLIPVKRISDEMSIESKLSWSLLNLLALKTRSFSGEFRKGLVLMLKSKQTSSLVTAMKLAADLIEGNNEIYKPSAWFLIGEVTAAFGTVDDTKKCIALLLRLQPSEAFIQAITHNQDGAVALATLECILGVVAAQASYAKDSMQRNDILLEQLNQKLVKSLIPGPLIRSATVVIYLLSQKISITLLEKLVTIVVSGEVKGEKLRRIFVALGTLGQLIVSGDVKKNNGIVPYVDHTVFARICHLCQTAEEDSVKSQALLTIGQLCIADRNSALRLVQTVSSFLQDQQKFATIVRMTALSVLADWCVWHTTVAEPYIDQMANCLRDSEPVMRRHSLGVIGRLLDGNYIRWQDTLFFRFVTAVIDDDASIRAAATRYFETIVIPREKQFFLKKFIETVLHFNGYVGAARVGTAFSQDSSLSSQQKRHEKQLATMALLLGLSGDQNRRRRFGIYKYMVDSMTTVEERLGLVHRLIDSILLAAVRDEIDVVNQQVGSLL